MLAPPPRALPPKYRRKSLSADADAPADPYAYAPLRACSSPAARAPATPPPGSCTHAACGYPYTDDRPLTAGLDACPAGMDADYDSDATLFFAHPRRISFSTSAERDTPFVRPARAGNSRSTNSAGDGDAHRNSGSDRDAPRHRETDGRRRSDRDRYRTRYVQRNGTADAPDAAAPTPPAPHRMHISALLHTPAPADEDHDMDDAVPADPAPAPTTPTPTPPTPDPDTDPDARSSLPPSSPPTSPSTVGFARDSSLDARDSSLDARDSPPAVRDADSDALFPDSDMRDVSREDEDGFLPVPAADEDGFLPVPAADEDGFLPVPAADVADSDPRDSDALPAAPWPDSAITRSAATTTKKPLNPPATITRPDAHATPPRRAVSSPLSDAPSPAARIPALFACPAAAGRTAAAANGRTAAAYGRPNAATGRANAKAPRNATGGVCATTTNTNTNTDDDDTARATPSARRPPARTDRPRARKRARVPGGEEGDAGAGRRRTQARAEAWTDNRAVAAPTTESPSADSKPQVKPQPQLQPQPRRKRKAAEYDERAEGGGGEAEAEGGSGEAYPAAPIARAEMQGLVIECLAAARATSMSVSALYAALMAGRPALRGMRRRRGVHGVGTQESESEEMGRDAWVAVIGGVLREGQRTCGVFGKVESSGKDDRGRALEPQWFYVPERDMDQERAALVRSTMPRAGKRSETMKYKQYYWRPLAKISRWDPEDDL